MVETGYVYGYNDCIGTRLGDYMSTDIPKEQEEKVLDVKKEQNLRNVKAIDTAGDDPEHARNEDEDWVPLRIPGWWTRRGS